MHTINHHIYGTCRVIKTDTGVMLHKAEWRHVATLTPAEYEEYMYNKQRRPKITTRRPRRPAKQKLYLTRQQRHAMGERITQLRVKALESQAVLSKAINTHQPTLSKIESGQLHAYKQDIEAIANHYNCTYEWLVGSLTD